MKVALLGPYPALRGRPMGGVQAAVEGLAGALSELGQDVTVIDPFTGYGPSTSSFCDVLRLPPLARWRVGLVRAPNYLTEAVGAVSPDVLHVHLGAQFTRLGRASVLTVHGFPHLESRLRNPGARGRLSGRVLRRPFMAGLAAADRVISISEDVTQLAAQIGSISVPIPNPVAQEFFDVRRRPGNDFIAVGDIMRRKNQKLLVDAFVDYVGAGGVGDLVLVGAVGDSQYYDACRASAARVGGRVRFVGPQVRAAVAELLAGAKAAVSASLRETSSIALAEALAANCPVLSLDVGTARVQVTRPEHGVLLPVDASSADVSAAMQDLATRATVAESARAAVMDQHPLTVAARTMAVYDSIASPTS